jgi:hypothetical protein
MSSGAQAIVLGAKGDEFPTVGFFVSLPLEFSQTGCLGGDGSPFEKERFGGSVALLSRRSNGFVLSVGQ